MKWNRRSDLEKDMISFCGGSMLATRKQIGQFLGLDPNCHRMRRYLADVEKFASKYPIYDVSEVIWREEVKK